MESSSLARRLARRFIAGDTLDDALRVARQLKAEGISVTLDRLGESVTTLAEAAQARDVYLEALDAMHASGLEPNVSIKLTQFGIDIDPAHCRANVGQLVRRAAELNGFVRVDMESSEYTDRTLDLVTGLHAESGSVGVVIQAYLFRSAADVQNLCERGIRVRLCKGAYLEPTEIAFPEKADVDRNFVELMNVLLERGTYPAIATHDPKMIGHTRACARVRHLNQDAFEFQMLYGIGRNSQRKLVRQGYRLRLYVPFGRAWYPYYMRRLAERPANVWFILRNLFR